MTKWGMISAIAALVLTGLYNGVQLVWDYEIGKNEKMLQMGTELGELRTEVEFLRNVYGECEELREYEGG